MSRLVLIGAGGHGRGTLEIVRARLAAGLPGPEPLGFVDDDPDRAEQTLGGLPVLGTVEWLIARGEDDLVAVVALAAPAVKLRLVPRLAAGGIRFVQAIHPSAILSAGVELGEGAIIGAGVVIAYDTRLGAHTTVNLNATLGHDCTIGDCTTIAPGVNITGNVTIGEAAEIQTNATIVPGLTLGARCRVGPGSVVLRDVGAGEFVFGNPARRVKATEADRP